jgi:hypothetical protein
LLPRRVSGLARKLHLVNKRFIVGYTGTVHAGKVILSDLERRFSSFTVGPSIKELNDALSLFPLLSVSWFTLALITTGVRCAARRSPRRRNSARRRGKRSARRGGNRAFRELPDQDGDARSGYEATEGSQPGSPSPLPNSGHELSEVSGVQSHGLCSLLPPFPSTDVNGEGRTLLRCRCTLLSPPFLLLR